ncbi:Della protein gai1 [Thalictrum thalictroides]|uniref:Della protein gai1 n=1 Tax=Thalictrum thalictroides TaxID=46969 RepID=A0A7J6VN16_THATH|nr:Della protein gai1 [Thalictrum thalictroides]
MLSHPFGCAFSGLGNEETNDVELAHLLLASAEKIGNQQYDRASKMLTQCAYLSSSTGSPVQRVSYYFAEALQERLNRETGRISFKGGKKGKQRMEFGVPIDYEEGQMNPSSALLECHQKLPFCQVLQFPGVQAIVEGVALARKVHLVDLGLQTGIAWTILMQALAARHECPVELFKLTAVGTDDHETEETGRRLANFAESMGLPFSFKPIILSNMADLKEDLFEITEDEAVAVYSPFVLRTMLTRSEHLDALMRVIRNLNPCIMVIKEIEAYHNSPSFFNRFIECLFFYSAFFDCLEACMDQNSQNRITTERHYFGHGIMNIVATEGEERTIRHVGIDVWRAFFARFGMVEIEFSHSSLYQANLIRKQFAYGSLCTLDMNKKCLTAGWKGTPLHTLSVWKFH